MLTIVVQKARSPEKMPATNPFHAMVSGYAELLRAAAEIPPGGLAPRERPRIAADAPKALIFSPHPDDECLTGGLPLRLLRELKMNVVNVAVTQGSRRDRRAERWRELKAACDHLGFGLVPTVEGGLEKIDLASHAREPEAWAASVEVIAGILAEHAPEIVLMPHEGDWHPTHIGTHHLVIDALSRMPPDFSCQVVETEFWGAMATPNLLVESSVHDVADLVAALSLHRGEVQRNPFHLRLPAWMMDNVRRGAELVQGRGEAAPAFTFATLYRLRRWTGGRLEDLPERGRLIACGDDLGPLLA
jgi:LmbE family N-acetylglucosaminyl deacetylase